MVNSFKYFYILESMPETSSKEVDKSNTSTHSQSDMSISELLSASWERVRLTWKKLLVLSIIFFGISVVVGFIYGFIIAFSVAGVALSGGNAAGLGVSLGIGGIVTLIFILALVVLQSALLVGMTRTLADPSDPKSALDQLKDGFGIVWPVILASIVVGLLATGGYFLFIIPGIFITVLLSATVFEIILHKQSLGMAMKNSASIVSQNFGTFFVRWMMMIGLYAVYYVIVFVVSAIPVIGTLFSLANMAFSFVVTWFFIAYWLLTYMQLREKTNFSKLSSTAWMYVVAVIGWILIALTTIAIGGATMMFIQTLANQKGASERSDSPYKYDYDFSSDMDAVVGGEDGSVQFNGSEIFDQVMEQEGANLTEEEKQQLEELRKMFATDGSSTESE